MMVFVSSSNDNDDVDDDDDDNVDDNVDYNETIDETDNSCTNKPVSHTCAKASKASKPLSQRLFYGRPRFWKRWRFEIGAGAETVNL